MDRPTYLNKYLFDWEVLDVVVSGKSAFDTSRFLKPMKDVNEVHDFLKAYGFDNNDHVARSELFGNFQEAIQFVRRFFLKEGNPEGLNLKIPNSLVMVSDISQLFVMASDKHESKREERLWAEVLLKIMHTIMHADKDLRSNYFNAIQTQIFDRFYKHIFRDQEGKLFIGEKGTENVVALVDFETKSKKTRESIIIKLLHKAENVAEELFDRVGVRFVTHTRFDMLRVINFLLDKHIIIPHNNKPSRSLNTMIDLPKFREAHRRLLKMAIRNHLSEERFVSALERACEDAALDGKKSERNSFSSKSYKSIQFTCRQLIEYKNPFLQEFNDLRKLAKRNEQTESELSKKVLNMDISLVARDIRFFYPFEIQIMDTEAYKANMTGEASHEEYKKTQVKSAMKRVFRGLIEFHKLDV